jgi:hypothetical protein
MDVFLVTMARTLPVKASVQMQIEFVSERRRPIPDKCAMNALRRDPRCISPVKKSQKSKDGKDSCPISPPHQSTRKLLAARIEKVVNDLSPTGCFEPYPDDISSASSRLFRTDRFPS